MSEWQPIDTEEVLVTDWGVKPIQEASKEELMTALRNASNEIRDLRQQSEWQPIETAPKDETEVILYFPNGYWMTGCNCAIGFWSPDGDWFAGEADSNPMTAFGSRPTHWMPLPPHPKD